MHKNNSLLKKIFAIEKNDDDAILLLCQSLQRIENSRTVKRRFLLANGVHTPRRVSWPFSIHFQQLKLSMVHNKSCSYFVSVVT